MNIGSRENIRPNAVLETFNYPADNYVIKGVSTNYQLSESKFIKNKITKEKFKPNYKEVVDSLLTKSERKLKRFPNETKEQYNARIFFEVQDQREYEKKRLAAINVQEVSPGINLDITRVKGNAKLSDNLLPAKALEKPVSKKFPVVEPPQIIRGIKFPEDSILTKEPIVKLGKELFEKRKQEVGAAFGSPKKQEPEKKVEVISEKEAADAMLGVQKERKETDFQKPVSPMKESDLISESSQVTAVGVQSSKPGSSQRQEAILKALEEGLNQNQIAKKFDVSATLISNEIKSMREKGILKPKPFSKKILKGISSFLKSESPLK